MSSKGFTVFVVLGLLEASLGGYFQTVPQYYPAGYPSVVQQPFLPPVSIVSVPQKQPLQLRPPAVALPNTRPPVTVIHAEQPRPTPNIPVVAIHAQQPSPSVVTVPAQQFVTVPNYSFSYAVKDPTTGDEKSHEESRNGDNVIGKYTVVEPDGTLRTVTYTAGVNGFNAIVERTPGYAPPNAPVKVVTVAKPVAISTPVAVAKPIAISNPAFFRPVGTNYPPGFHFGG